MSTRLIASTLAAAVLLVAGGWFVRDTAAVQSAARTLGLAPERPTPTTTETLHAAGVHKCLTHEGVLYVDAACPKGSREMKAGGGTVTVMPFPKAAPAPSALASGVFGGPLVTPQDREERDRLRDKVIEDAANRR